MAVLRSPTLPFPTLFKLASVLPHGQRSIARITSGAMRLPSYVEATYGASILEWVRQTYDGRMDFGATTTTVVEDLTGRKPLTHLSSFARG